VPGTSVDSPRDTPLVELFPIPRELVDAEISCTTGGVRFR
jgi:hypothetical protein